MLDIDGYGKPPDTLSKVATAISFIDGKRGDATETVCSKGIRLLPLGERHKFSIDVRQRSIIVKRDGTEITRWSGDPTRLTLHEEYWAVPDRMRPSGIALLCFQKSA